MSRTQTTGDLAWWSLTFPDLTYLHEIKIFSQMGGDDTTVLADLYLDGNVVPRRLDTIKNPYHWVSRSLGKVLTVRGAVQSSEELVLVEVEVYGSIQGRLTATSRSILIAQC